MNSVREFRGPLLVAGGAIVVALLLWLALIAPQNSKLSSLRSKQDQLSTQQSTLEAKLASLRAEQHQLAANCSDLQKIATQIPSVQTPTDVDAEESSFEQQFNDLTAASAVKLVQFSGFAPATPGSTSTTATSSSSTTKAGAAPSGVTAVPTNIAVSGTYGQIMAFVNGLDSFPRLFVIQSFVLATGSGQSSSSASSSGSSATGTSSASGAPGVGSTPIWVGGQPSTSTQVTLTVTGSIYYTTSPNALDACTKAAQAAQQTSK